MTKLIIPRNFLNWLWKNGPTPSQEDLHLALLIQKVYFRIPVCFRAVLREYVLDVNVLSGTDTNLLGSVYPTNPSHVYNGNIADIAKDNVYVDVTLYRDELKGSDSACLFVIAHEFAHVVLRHHQIGLVLASFAEFPRSKRYKDKDSKLIHELHEEEADLQAWVWGFEKEFRKLHQEFPDVRKPRWFMDIYTEPYNEQQ
jgi:hypothetical protein